MQDDASPTPANKLPEGWDTSSHEDFYKYYEQHSLSAQTMDRFRSTCSTLLRVLASDPRPGPLNVLDIGCGAGAQSQFWLERGHRYWGMDINEPLILLARERAQQQGLAASFEVGTATALPFADQSMDICLLPELLEHVADWKACVDEAVRVVRPRGLIYINTSSKLCPRQQEFNLPLYAWYPQAIKRYFERRAVSDWPALANHAKYPAVNWFSFYGLRDYIEPLGFACLDRFDLIDRQHMRPAAAFAVQAVRSSALLRLLAQVATPYTLVVGRRL